MKEPGFYRLIRKPLGFCFKTIYRPTIIGTENIPKNGASMLLEQLLWADKITIFCGTQVNEAYEQIKPGMRLRDTLVEKLTLQLQNRNKEVMVYYY